MAENIEKLTNKEEGMGPKIKFADDFWIMIDLIGRADSENDVLWNLSTLETDSGVTIPNKIGITSVNVSSKPDYFEILTGTKPGSISVHQFLKYFFKKKLTDKQIQDFLKLYNKLVTKGSIELPSEKKYTSSSAKYQDFDEEGVWGGEYSVPSYAGGFDYYKKQMPLRQGTLVKVPPFSYNPKDVRATFLSLTTKTYPYGNEEDVMAFMPKSELEKDEWGNYYKVIGNSDTMFTSHLDTADRGEGKKVSILSYEKDGDEIFITDGTSILGADDKAGVSVMLYMMAHNIPGIYYYFIGEERGAIGSSKVADNFDTIPHLRGVKKCISFDRRNYFSVITSQLSQTCCSNEFAQSLANELNKSGLELRLDNTGVFTDSASFMDLIAECTNVSVGYFSEHTHDEMQNISYLERLAKACVEADWNALSIKRRVGLDPMVAAKHNSMLTKIKRSRLFNDQKAFTDEDKLYITLEVDDTSITRLKGDIDNLKTIFKEFKIEPVVKFDNSIIKFEID
jgi:hypothetical protein